MMLVRWVSLIALLPLAACGGDGLPLHSSCIPGASVACACTDGRQGAQVCRSDGTFAACQCDAHGSSPDASAPMCDAGTAFLPDGAGTEGCGTAVSPPSCGLPVTSSTSPTDEPGLLQLVVGTWLRCSCPSGAGTIGPMASVGVEFTPDKHFYFLYLDGAGKLVRGGSFDDQGTYDYTGGSQMNFHFATGGGNGGHPVFSACPRKFEILFDCGGAHGCDSVFAAQ